jgi:FixJ family two-component response regulator
MHFDMIHSNFLSRLKERFPDLSSNDLKLCAYLKMNLTSKEIAQLMSITIKAVEVSRYRLRKKMQIPSDMPLFDYLINAINYSQQEHL